MSSVITAVVLSQGAIWLVIVFRAKKEDLPTIAKHLSQVFRRGKPMS